MGIYYPHPSPTGKCARQYVDLLKGDYDVDVIYIRSCVNEVDGLLVDGRRLFGLLDWRLKLEVMLDEFARKTVSKILRTLSCIGILCVKAVGKLQSMVLFPNNLKWFYKKAYRKLEAINREYPVDVVFTVNSPFSAHLAGEMFKKRHLNIRWVTYTVDSFYAGSKGSSKRANGRLKRAFLAEKRVLANADVNFLSEEVYEHGTELYADIRHKTLPLPYVLPEPSVERYDGFDPEKINLVYAGRFYKDIRNPEYLFQTFLLTTNPDVILHLYAVSDCEALLDEYVKKSAGRIVRHEIVSVSEIKKVLNSADFLVSIGNSVPEFKPSKIFEYIASGIPIINFYYAENVDDVLTRYPLSLQISNKLSHVNAANCIDGFIVGNKGLRVPYSKITELYKKNSPEKIGYLLSTAMGEGRAEYVL